MLHKILKNPQAVIGLVLIGLICAVALLAPVLAPNDPNAVDPLLKYQPASAQFPLGTDHLGRCELSRLFVRGQGIPWSCPSHIDFVGRDRHGAWYDDSLHRWPL